MVEVRTKMGRRVSAPPTTPSSSATAGTADSTSVLARDSRRRTGCRSPTGLRSDSSRSSLLRDRRIGRPTLPPTRSSSGLATPERSRPSRALERRARSGVATHPRPIAASTTSSVPARSPRRGLPSGAWTYGGGPLGTARNGTYSPATLDLDETSGVWSASTSPRACIRDATRADGRHRLCGPSIRRRGGPGRRGR